LSLIIDEESNKKANSDLFIKHKTRYFDEPDEDWNISMEK